MVLTYKLTLLGTGRWLDLPLTQPGRDRTWSAPIAIMMSLTCFHLVQMLCNQGSHVAYHVAYQRMSNGLHLAC